MAFPDREDLRTLIGDEFADLPIGRQYARIETELQFNRYTPDSQPETATTNLYNPAVDGYKDAGLSWTEDGWQPIDNTNALGKFPEYVPTDDSIQMLINAGSLVEVGAGDGYWSHIINQNGGVCLPTDIRPEATDTDEYPHTKIYPLDGKDDYELVIWADVKEQDGVTAVQNHRDRDVVMCHPSCTNRWSERVLDALSTDQRFILIAEWYPGADATPMFFKTLCDDFTLNETFPVYNWASTHARGYIFTKL